ncbi:hypothetical protein E5Q_02151 [Mixia osmundae IAM 14324]|uniref:Major facilitator superfamily (MFS) profile domain-containing protein n=1 Tax=Mixia osmundae (strain CBS 9802 / IAM 14324 / JCM 22182 / KY 12970) TaxID=764103 RepID=G7DY36_MIXOS|nr:hypothetical protein E5Q_02151 [Mixia osmundae IAM 14324]
MPQEDDGYAEEADDAVLLRPHASSSRSVHRHNIRPSAKARQAFLDLYDWLSGPLVGYRRRRPYEPVYRSGSTMSAEAVQSRHVDLPPSRRDGVMKRVYHNLPRIPKSQARLDEPTTPALLRKLTGMQWLYFFAIFIAWMSDSVDFFSVALNVTLLRNFFATKQPDISIGDITTSITLTLLFRTLGAIIFGIAADKYGRKWPLVVDLLLCAAFSLATGFVTTFEQFLVVRSCFGIAMGGVSGMTIASLERLPIETRGLLGGVLQQGYSTGFLVASIFKLAYVDSHTHGYWQASFCAHRFLHDVKIAARRHWRRFLYAVALMAGFNFYSHGSQDLYPSFIQQTKGLSASLATKSTIIGNLGALVGSLAGGLSQHLGRRLTIIVCCIWAACFIPLWILPSSFSALALGAFCLQIGIQGAFSVVPAYLLELSPVAVRATFPGVAYQLGNAISASSAQIEARAGEGLMTPEGRPDYGKAQAILVAVVSIYLIVLVCFGREYPEGESKEDANKEESNEGEKAIDEENATGKPEVQNTEE